MTTDDTATYQLAFASIRGMNRLLAERLLARVGSEKGFFDASESQLKAITGFRGNIFTDGYRSEVLEKAKAEIEYTDFSGIERIYYTDPGYPRRLDNADDAPLMLYSLGASTLNDGVFISIVGTRHATPYGVDFVNRLIADLAAKAATPVTIVSGLAFGIDIAAHRAAIKHSLPTIAVLAHGLNTIYPSAHRNDAAAIAAGAGRLITEYASTCPVHKGNFLARNRIVAALSDCTVVVESAEKGGALSTARIALDYHRDVFALPGRISDRYSSGCNRLIASNSAGLIQSADDLIDAMGWPRIADAPQQKELFPTLSEAEQAIVDYLTSRDGAGINELSVNLDINIGKLTAMLIDMEFRSLVLKYPGGKYRLA